MKDLRELVESLSNGAASIVNVDEYNYPPSHVVATVLEVARYAKPLRNLNVHILVNPHGQHEVSVALTNSLTNTLLQLAVSISPTHILVIDMATQYTLPLPVEPPTRGCDWDIVYRNLFLNYRDEVARELVDFILDLARGLGKELMISTFLTAWSPMYSVGDFRRLVKKLGNGRFLTVLRDVVYIVDVPGKKSVRIMKGRVDVEGVFENVDEVAEARSKVRLGYYRIME